MLTASPDCGRFKRIVLEQDVADIQFEQVAASMWVCHEEPPIAKKA